MRKRSFLAGCVTIGVATVLAALPALAVGVAPAKPEDAAAKLLDRFVEVTGGKAAHAAICSTMIRLTLTLPAQDITLAMTLYQARPNRLYTRLESEVTGIIESGVNGDVAWESSAMGGPRLKEGQEKADALRDANFDALARWRDFYAKAELAGADSVGGAVCDKVVLTPVSGTPRTAYIDRASGLIVRYDLTAETPAGAVTVKSLLGDYRKEGGVLMPHRTEIDALGQRRVMVMDSVAVNPEIPAGRFDPPAEVRKLLEAKK